MHHSTAVENPTPIIEDSSSPEPPPPARFDDPAMAHYHMRRHFDDLRMVEQLFMAGKVDEGATLAYLLVRQTDDPGMLPWQPQSKAVADAALALTTAESVDEGLRQVARVAEACAECHAHAQSLPLFAPAPDVPPNKPSREARMARHAWATDRLWEGMIGPNDDRWKAGLDVLAATPLPFAPLNDAPALADRLQQLARDQLAQRSTTLLHDRAIAYGEILVTCAACHSSLRVQLR
jgi:cytochrome c553